MTVDDRKCKARTGTAVLCYARLPYFEIWQPLQSFGCKASLPAALRYMRGVPQHGRGNTFMLVFCGVR